MILSPNLAPFWLAALLALGALQFWHTWGWFGYPKVSSNFVNNHISIKAAVENSGYSLEYLRWLLRRGMLAGF